MSFKIHNRIIINILPQAFVYIFPVVTFNFVFLISPILKLKEKLWSSTLVHAAWYLIEFCISIRVTWTDTDVQQTHHSVTIKIWPLEKSLISLSWKYRKTAEHIHTHSHRYTTAHPADTSVWPHSYLKRFHLLTVRPVFPPADVFWGQYFFEKTLRASTRQEKPTSAILDRILLEDKSCTFQEFSSCVIELLMFWRDLSVWL